MNEKEETNELTIIGMSIVVLGIAVDSTFDANLLDPANIAGLLITLSGVLVLLYVVIKQSEYGDIEDDSEP